MTTWQENVQDKRWVIHVEGRLDQHLTPSLESRLLQLLQEDGVQIIVNLAKANYINSGGLRCLVTAWRKARQQKGDLLICGLNGRLQGIFEIAGFDQLFDLYANAKAAQQHLP